MYKVWPPSYQLITISLKKAVPSTRWFPSYPSNQRLNVWWPQVGLELPDVHLPKGAPGSGPTHSLGPWDLFGSFSCGKGCGKRESQSFGRRGARCAVRAPPWRLLGPPGRAPPLGVAVGLAVIQLRWRRLGMMANICQHLVGGYYMLVG